MSDGPVVNTSPAMDYLARARKLGQSVERLQAGERVETIVQINSIEEFRELFAGNLTEDQRASCSADLAARHAEGLAGEDPMTRLIAYVAGSSPLSAEDARTAQKMFPVRIRAISQVDMTLTNNDTYGPTAAPVVLNVRTLTFNGGSITTKNTVLTLQADTVAFGKPTQNSLPYHIGILGVDGKDGSAGTSGADPSPAQAAMGASSSSKSPGICTGAGSGRPGGNGASGHAGGSGGTGQNGFASLPATITIGAFSTTQPGTLVLFTQSGAGGPGGVGGKGGAGQRGGDGGLGCDSGCEGTDGGNGGDGGAGGIGGNGGQGGNGVNGFNITVTVPSNSINQVVRSSAVAPVGKPGLAGAGGSGGGYGSPGKGGKHSRDGSYGRTGDPGAKGTDGVAGTQQGSPGQFFVNGK